ncbi:MAG: hypothetical protein KatS3mg078_2334 [Deltaproteobacteria bacterium]|nr:MAG: hypothetical protein KatS3mg078_2334 [Deltaproteobacteria bacterium]
MRFQLERDLDGIKLGVLDSLIPLKNFYKTEQKKIIASKERVNRIYGEILALKESVALASERTPEEMQERVRSVYHQSLSYCLGLLKITCFLPPIFA